ncbi:MAG: hypothetical protein ACLQVF_08400, partial [Isosphaeraceae bacterium]
AKSNWVETVRGFGRLFQQAAGRSSSLVHSKSAAGLRAHLVARRRADRTGRTVLHLTSSNHAHAWSS